MLGGVKNWDMVTGKPRRAWHGCMASVHGPGAWLPGWWGCWIGEVEPEHWGLVLDEVW